MASPEPGIWTSFFYVLGVIGAGIFYGRFYVQWIVSEIRRESTFPVVFWYMSSAGSLMLLSYAVSSGSPVGALSHCFNIIVYSRNLVYIWRKGGKLSAGRSLVFHGVVAAVAFGALGLVGLTWWREIEATQEMAGPESARKWFWIAVGVAGMGLFACRFLVQWLATERKKESVVPVVFWYFSLAAAILLTLSHLNQREWLFAIGVGATIVIYFRNLWLIYRNKPVMAIHG